MSGLRGKCGARCGSRRGGSVGGLLEGKSRKVEKGVGMVFTRPMVWDMVFFVMGARCVGVFIIDSLVMRKCDAESKTGACTRFAYLKRMYRHCWLVLAKY